MTTFRSERGRILPPDLDDRTWQDLVDEMRALIPTYTKEWTDHGPGDPGITLIELFAWLAEGIIYRLNQVPEKNYVAFLNLLGITRVPARPARTYLTFTGSHAPKGSQAYTAAREGEIPVVFETDEDVLLLPTILDTALLFDPHDENATSAPYADVTPDLVGPPAVNRRLILPAGKRMQLCLGFDRAVTEELSLRLRLHPPAPPGLALEWAYSQGATTPLAWPTIGEEHVTDNTAALRRNGTVLLTVPHDWAEQPPPQQPSRDDGRPAGDGHGGAPAVAAARLDQAVDVPTGAMPGATAARRYWIGARIRNGSGAPVEVGFDRILFNSALAHTALTVRVPEELGVSDGEPHQRFVLRHRPLFRCPDDPAPYGHLEVEVGQGHRPTTWQRWQLVDELPPGPAQVYRVDPVTGEISFGSYRQQSGHGLIPPAGSRIRARYRYVAAGADGNVAAGRVTQVGTGPDGELPAGITTVVNLGAAVDGCAEEPVEETLRRAPELLKNQDRAVTADDYEFLARAASTRVWAARCLAPRLTHPSSGTPWRYAGIVRAPGRVNLVIVANQGPDVPRPQPPDELVREVHEYLDQRRDVTAQLCVHGPRYLPIMVKTTIMVWNEAVLAGVDEARVKADTLRGIMRFLHPTCGGPAGRGWQVGQHVVASDLFRAIVPPQDIGYVSELLIRPCVPPYFHSAPTATDDCTPQSPRAHAGKRPFDLPNDFGSSVRVADYELVCAASEESHTVGISKQDF